ncbi:glycoside hydrolase family 3 N-terminal domain-containing protein, partial [Anaerolineales bacterium HSG25]|nr:glycoside hydrolase family 3 N-terminal domain-containing protein [Anaerolineales bacterium HSG25]
MLNRLKRILFAVTLISLTQLPASIYIDALPVSIAPVPVQADEPSDSVAEIMRRMSVEDKVGQLFLVPFVGSWTTENSDIWVLLTEYKIGGVIILAANSNFVNDETAPTQITELTNSLQASAFETNQLPLFVALDHEGDNFPYTRVTGGVTDIPSQMAIGATWQPNYAESVGEIVGEELSVMGVNMVLGPVIDVLNDPRPTERGDIGIRVYGGDPYWVSQMGRAYIRGLHQGSQGHIVSVAKHFPGHGGSDRLPDNEVATVDKSLQELQRIELPPFFHLMADLPDDPLGQTDAVMSSHIRYRGFQGDIRQFTAPISFDAEGMGTLFALPEMVAWRKQGGVIVSDALGVPAVRKHFDPSLNSFPHRRIAKEAFLAGNDILSLVQFDSRSIWSQQFENIKDTVTFFQNEYRNNPTFAKRVDEAVTRIIQLKLKLYPKASMPQLTRDPEIAMQIGAQSRPVIHEIAQSSLSLLYPSADELKLRIPEPPRSDKKILVIVDVRLSRECYTAACQPKEVYLARDTLEQTILRFYGDEATGQIQPENISTITFSELKLALTGAIDLPTMPTEAVEETPPQIALPTALPDDLTKQLGSGASPTATPTPKAEETVSDEVDITVGEGSPIQIPPAEVRRQIQSADWLIFAALDLNTKGFSDSDALQLFLAQESAMLRDKTTVVVAFNAPYYLDTTEVTKLTAYYGAYSKTKPHVETAVRALFGELTATGKSPVSIDGLGYELVTALAPDSEQDLAISLISVEPESRVLPVKANVQVGPIVDYNGNLVPDGTPVELVAYLEEREIASTLGHTVGGMVEVALRLNEAGSVQIVAQTGPLQSRSLVTVSVL